MPDLDDIFRIKGDEYLDGVPGIWAVGQLLTNGLHPWSRTNPWAYDGAIYGYRAFQALGDSQYWVLGQQMYVTNPTAESAATYAAELAELNAGCNYAWRGTPMAGAYADFTDDVTASIFCPSDGGDTTSVIKCSMLVWGVVRDILTFNNPGPDDALLYTSYGFDSGNVFLGVATPSTAARNHWLAWAGEVIALWVA